MQEKTLSVTHHPRNAHKNHIEIAPPHCQNGRGAVGQTHREAKRAQLLQEGEEVTERKAEMRDATEKPKEPSLVPGGFLDPKPSALRILPHTPVYV